MISMFGVKTPPPTTPSTNNNSKQFLAPVVTALAVKKINMFSVKTTLRQKLTATKTKKALSVHSEPFLNR